MKCDINPDHGEMREEPMYGKDHEILQYGYFCQVPGCDGYGGPVPTKKIARKKAEPEEQLTLFKEG
jgi:hypothetical protein